MPCQSALNERSGCSIHRLADVLQKIACVPCVQAVLDVVRESASLFDPVCMATAVHKMATFRKPAAYYRRISQYGPFQELQTLIGMEACLPTLEEDARPE